MTHFQKVQQGLRRLARAAGWEVAYRGFLAYYLLRDPDVPASHKSVILGALGYLLMPIDAIPDAIVGIGYTDDLTVLAGMFHLLDGYITPAIRRQAESAAYAVFG